MTLDARKILLVSLLFNALLTLAVVLQTSVLAARKSPPRRAITLTTTHTHEAALAAPADPPPPAPPELPPLPPGFHWSQVESQDLSVYVGNLQAIGCPPETIYDIIKPEHYAQFEARVEKILAPFATQFWEIVLKGMKHLESEYGKALEALSEEKKTAWKKLESLIGYQPPSPARPSRNFQRLIDFLPAGKQKQLGELIANYERLEADLAKTGDQPIPADQPRKLNDLRDQRLAAIKNLLTPAEFDEYQLRSSPHAHWAERVLGFEPRPAEYTAIARLKLKLDAEFPIPKADDSEARDLKAQRQIAEDLRLLQLLGPQRFAEYQRGLDPGYQAAVKVATHFDLPPERAAQVYDIKRAADEHLRSLRADTTLSEDDRAAAVAAARQQITQSLRQLLGEKAYQTYERHNGGWLKPTNRP